MAEGEPGDRRPKATGGGRKRKAAASGGQATPRPGGKEPQLQEPDGYEVAIGEQRVDLARLPPAKRREAEAPAQPPPPPRARRAEEDEVPPAPDPADTRLVQFTQNLSAGDMERIRREYGLALTAYVPNFTYVERVDAETELRLRSDPLVRAVASYLPEFKIAASIADPARPRPEGIPQDKQLLDAFLFDGGSPERVIAAIEAAGGRDIKVLDDRPIGGRARVRFLLDTDDPVPGLATVPDIRWIEPVPAIKDDNVGAASVNQSGQTGNAVIWAKGLHGEGQVIGIIDRGPPDIRHCFFADAPPNNFGPGHRKVLDIRNVAGTAASDHATFTSGCVAGDDRGNSGGHNRRGGAWAAKLVCGNRLDLPGTTLLAELNAARTASAVVHSNSWHNRNNPRMPAVYDQQAADVDTFTWANEDHLVLGSSGNTGEEQAPPGTAKNAICVAASQGGDNPTTFGDGNPGPTADSRRKPDLVAVGCGIESATVNTPCGTGPRSACASSYATPHAAAAAALIRQYFREGWYPTGAKVAANAFTPTGNLLKAVLISSTVDLTGQAGYPSVSEGWGLIRLDRALFFAGARRKLMVWDVRHATGPTTGDIRNHIFDIDDDTEQLKVVLVFNDPAPATGASAFPRVNDLDLTVTAPNGTVYKGNFLTNGVSTPNVPNVGDGVNTVEVVVVNSPPAGRWTVEVFAAQVNVGNPGQGYAVAASARMKSSRCFVASAVYGDPDHPDVEVLRGWRDGNIERVGARGETMRLMAAAYQRVGPMAARAVEGRPAVKWVLRRRVFPNLARLVDPKRASWR